MYIKLIWLLRSCRHSILLCVPAGAQPQHTVPRPAALERSYYPKLHSAQEYIHAPLRNTSNNMQTYVLCSGRADPSAHSKLGNWEEVFDFLKKNT